MRPSRRAPDELRPVSLESGVVKYAEGSCLVEFGDTQVLVTATLEDGCRLAEGQGPGLGHGRIRHAAPRHAGRTRREAAAGKQAAAPRRSSA